MTDSTTLDPTARELAALHAARAPRWRLEPLEPSASTIPGPVSCADLAVAGALLADYTDREPLAGWQLLDAAHDGAPVDLGALTGRALRASGGTLSAMTEYHDGTADLGGPYPMTVDLAEVAVALLALIGGDR